MQLRPYSLILINLYNDLSVINIDVLNTVLFNMHCDKWKENIVKKPKLRTYIIYKTDIFPEQYILKPQSRQKRSLHAQYRSGTLPLAIETGRYTPIYDPNSKSMKLPNAAERFCLFCKSGKVEDEFHFLCECSCYTSERNALFSKIIKATPEFTDYTLQDKFIFINKYHQLDLSNYIKSAWEIRKQLAY